MVRIDTCGDVVKQAVFNGKCMVAVVYSKKHKTNVVKVWDRNQSNSSLRTFYANGSSLEALSVSALPYSSGSGVSAVAVYDDHYQGRVKRVVKLIKPDDKPKSTGTTVVEKAREALFSHFVVISSKYAVGLTENIIHCINLSENYGEPVEVLMEHKKTDQVLNIIRLNDKQFFLVVLENEYTSLERFAGYDPDSDTYRKLKATGLRYEKWTLEDESEKLDQGLLPAVVTGELEKLNVSSHQTK